MSEEEIFYVYVYLDPRKPGTYKYPNCEFEYSPFYVGKGKGVRLYKHLKKAKNSNHDKSHKTNTIVKILEIGLEPIILKIADNLTEESALKLEEITIDYIGRSILGEGPLTNVIAGGFGVKSGVFSPNFGYKHSKEACAKMSKALKGKYTGEAAYAYGRPVSEETRMKLSVAKKGKFTKEQNGKYGKPLSAETRAKISASNMGRPGTQTGRSRSEANKDASSVANTTHKYYITTPDNEILIVYALNDDYLKYLQVPITRRSVANHIKSGKPYKNWQFREEPLDANWIETEEYSCYLEYRGRFKEYLAFKDTLKLKQAA